MGYSQINFTTPANLISQLEAAMISAGWTDTGLNGALGSGSGNILRSTADSDGRVCYVELYVDTASRLGIHVSPVLNAGATDIDPNMNLFRASDFQAGNWEGFIYGDFVVCMRGNDPDNYKFWFGRYSIFPNISATLHKYACTMHGTYAIDGGAALRPRPLSRNQAAGGVYYTVSWGNGIWKRIGLGQYTHVWSTGSHSSWSPDIGFLDGTTLFCSIPIILGQESSQPDRGGCMGYLPHAILTYKDVALSSGDRVTLDSGVTYYRLGVQAADYDQANTNEVNLMFEV